MLDLSEAQMDFITDLCEHFSPHSHWWKSTKKTVGSSVSKNNTSELSEKQLLINGS